MPHESLEVRPCAKPRHVLTRAGTVLAAPADWSLLPPGDAALSRRIKQDGPTWTVIEMKGRKRFSHGIWAPAARIDALRTELMQERQDPAYAKKLAAGRERRAQEQAVYSAEFEKAVYEFLAFHPRHEETARALALLISNHAVPVGSGTVARTERIPIQQRAEAATIAWLRHQTTGYDSMFIARKKGQRREVRQQLAQQSRRLLSAYREGQAIDHARCPLSRALPRPAATNSAAASEDRQATLF